MIWTTKVIHLACLFFLPSSLVNGLFSHTRTQNSDQVSEIKLSRLVRDVRLSLLHQDKLFSGERVKRQMVQMQKMQPLTIAVTDWTSINNLNRKPSFVSATSLSHAQHINTKDPGLSLADSLAFSLDIQGPLGDSSSKFQGNQNVGAGATSSANSAAGTGQKGGPALAGADTSAQISGIDAGSLGSAATVNKANVFMVGNAAGVSNARGSVNVEDSNITKPVLQPSDPQPQQAVTSPKRSSILTSTTSTTTTTTTTMTSSTTSSTTSKTTTAAPIITQTSQDESHFEPEANPRRKNQHGPRERNRQNNRHNSSPGNFGEPSSIFPINTDFGNMGSSDFGNFNNGANAFGSFLPFINGNGSQPSRDIPFNTKQAGLKLFSLGSPGIGSSPTAQFPSLFGSSSFASNNFPAFSSFQG